MLKEFFDAMKATITDAIVPQVDSINSTESKLAIRSAAGYEWVTRPDLPREHTAKSIESFADAVARYGMAPAVWLDHDYVVCLLDHMDRHQENLVRMRLNKSDCFDALHGKWLNQKQLVQLLQFDLHAATHGNLLPAVRRLQFSKSSETDGRVEQDTESLGKSVTARITGASDIPGQVGISFLAYPNLESEGIDTTVEIPCQVRVDFAEEKLALVPLPGQIEAAMLDSMATIAAAIRSQLEERQVTGASVFLGSP